MKKTIHQILILCLLAIQAHGQETKKYDICIYGATSAGVIAAYTASKSGKSVILVDPTTHIGGLSSGGLGQTDIGNKYVVKGLALDFYRKLGQNYGALENWVFEPKVAKDIFLDYLKNCNAVQLLEYRLTKTNKEGARIKSTEFASVSDDTKTTTIEAKVFMDCTYEGDLFALAGASYHIGREANDTYGETLNGVQLLQRHQLPDGVDPYVERGNPESGLIWGISAENLQPNGTGDRKVQAYNYRITLTDNPRNRIPITQPDNYDPNRYELLRRQKEIQPWQKLSDIFIWSKMPNRKTDINNRNGFSTDAIGMNWDYPEADYKRRLEIIKEHEDYTKGLLYFVGHDNSVPQSIREEMKKWGYPKDEYVDNGHWSPQLYIREARRLVGELVMTQHHCQGRETVDDEVGYAAYTMDSHNCDRLVVNGMVKNEGNVEVGGFPPFPISYRAIVPKRGEVDNLIVPVCLSASHIAFGSIRMEPVFMVLAQSGAVAACQAIDQKIAVQDVDINRVKKVLEENPKADGRPADILVQVSDKGAVALKGDWKKSDGKGYGMYYLENHEATKGASARFYIRQQVKGDKRYRVYTYYPKSKKSSPTYTVKLFDGRSETVQQLDLSKVSIKGQTKSTWVYVHDIELKGDTKKAPYIEVSNENANGTVAANAILLVPITE